MVAIIVYAPDRTIDVPLRDGGGDDRLRRTIS
jgi:hypothetical protein